jgi:hypothetical protein
VISLSRRGRAASRLPWCRPRNELLLLTLVACALLPIAFRPASPDVSRLCLTQALTAGRTSADACLAGNIDRAEHQGHLYSDKAPGLSVLAIPAVEATRLPPVNELDRLDRPDLRLWAVWLSTVGLSYLLLVWMIGRVSEGLVAGTGGVALVAAGVGTLLGALAVAPFGHVPAAMLGFAAFLLAWNDRPLAAGLLIGLAVCVEYQAGLIALPLVAYIGLRGARAVGRFLIGLVPGGVALAVYDQVSFGSPLRLSYRYVAPRFAGQQESGFFGIHAPTAHGIWEVLVAGRGLLPSSPITLAAAVGLVLLWRRGWRREALLSALVGILFLALATGYYDPYGGVSPGPRFLVPALPFIALGIAPLYARFRGPTLTLAATSVVSMTAIAWTWDTLTKTTPGYRQSVWGEIVRMAGHGRSSRLLQSVGASVLTWLHLGRWAAAAPEVAAAAAAVAVIASPAIAAWARRV